VRRTKGPPIIHPAGYDHRELEDGCALDREKMRGYEAGLASGGLRLADMPIIETVPWDTGVGAAIFAAAPDATAILAMSDRQASLVLAEAARRGIDVPGHISVVGFDGVPESASTAPPLTTIAQPTREKGHLAAQMLLGEEAAPRQIELPVELVVRASTAPPRA
jgi:DNA-binding LacI/PurR family transcriptional regulator